MTDHRPIFVYAEAAPVDDNVAAPGLYRASVPILKSIADHIAMIALYPQDRRYGLSTVHPALRALSRRLPAIFSWLRLARRRLLPDDFENAIVARIVGRWARQSGASQILALEGSDPEVLARVDAIAARTGMPFSVYLVDDFEWTMRLNGRTEADIAATTARMRKSLSRARHVFAITDELGALLHKQFGITPITLRLAFEPRPALSLPRKDQIFFLGSINFLYLSALRTLLEIVARLRAQTGRNITVRFTHGGSTALDPLPDFVHAAPIADADVLAEEIAASLFAFLPYAFEPPLRIMVETSFPSKSMECLAYARSIVVYAPDYSNSARSFTKAGLPTVTNTAEALAEEIRRQLETPSDHAAKYRAYLAIEHGPQAARKTLLSALLGRSS
jgi:hypothetical protein